MIATLKLWSVRWQSFHWALRFVAYLVLTFFAGMLWGWYVTK